jgi:SAM-dependent methyltransferase
MKSKPKQGHPRSLSDFERSLADLRRQVAELRSQVAGLTTPRDLPLFVETGEDLLPTDLDEYVMRLPVSGWDELVTAAVTYSFRGSPEAIAVRQAWYLPIIAQTLPEGLPVVDLGCGRGEFLHLLRQEGFPAIGVETNDLYVDELRARGFQVEQEDALDFLQHQADESVGAITAFQFVEHVSVEFLQKILDVAMRKLAPGGVVLLETVNPHCLASFRMFYLDPTHTRPIPQPFLSLLLKLHGYKETRVFFSSPAQVANVSVEPAVTAFHYHDYAVMGRKESR